MFPRMLLECVEYGMLHNVYVKGNKKDHELMCCTCTNHLKWNISLHCYTCYLILIVTVHCQAII